MDFSGEWDGFYIYVTGYDADYFGEKVKFRLTVDEDDREIKGTCQEEENEFANLEMAKVHGFIAEDGMISFVLEYPSLVFVADDGETHREKGKSMSVRYEGEYDETTDTFFGDWDIDERVVFEGEEYYLEGNGIWKMTRNIKGEKGSRFNEIYQLIESKFTNIKAIQNTVLFNIEGHSIHINGNGSANSISKTKQAADCTIIITENNILDILNQKTIPAFLVDKDVKTEGNIGVLIKVQTLLGF